MNFAQLDNGIVNHIGGGEDYLILPPGCVEITDGMTVNIGDIYEDGAFRTPTQDDLNRIHRPAFNAERDRLFAATAWVRQRHEDRVDLGHDDTENWTAWLAYWQSLRDMPDAAGFDASAPVWPEPPE